MVSVRKLAMLLAGPVVFLGLLGQTGLPEAGGGGPEKVLLTETTRIDMAFKATLSDEARKDIFKFFSLAEFKMGQKWSSVALNDLLVEQRGVIEAADPKYFANLSTHIVELTGIAQKAIDSQLSQKLAAGFNETADLLKADLEKDKPALRWRATYQYVAGSRDKGDPGWINPPGLELTAGKAFSRGGAVELDAIELAVPGTTIKLPIKARLTFSLATTYDVVDGNICESARDEPQTVIGGSPILIMKAALDVASNGSIATNGTYLNLACTKRIELPRCRTTLTAQPSVKDPS